MAASQYEKLIDGKPVDIKMTRAGNTKLKLACCHCGLVHMIGIAVRGNNVGFAATQIPRATAQRRAMLKRKHLGIFGTETGKKLDKKTKPKNEKASESISVSRQKIIDVISEELMDYFRFSDFTLCKAEAYLIGGGIWNRLFAGK